MATYFIVIKLAVSFKKKDKKIKKDSNIYSTKMKEQVNIYTKKRMKKVPSIFSNKSKEKL